MVGTDSQEMKRLSRLKAGCQARSLHLRLSFLPCTFTQELRGGQSQVSFPTHPSPLPIQGTTHQARMPSKFWMKRSQPEVRQLGEEDSISIHVPKYMHRRKATWGVGLYPTLRGDLVCWLVVVLGSAKTGASHSPWTSPCTRPWALEMGVWFAETYRERPSSGLSAGP